MIDTDNAIERRSESADDTDRIVSVPGVHWVIPSRAVRLIACDDAIALVVGQPRSSTGGAEATDRNIIDALAAAGSGSARASLSGHFAAVHVDRRNRCVQLLTDRFGLHPLCYAVEGRRLAFSDRADAVPTNAPSSIDPQGLFNYAYFHVLPAPRTIFRYVARMEPAQRLIFSERGLGLASTWMPQFRSAGYEHREPTAAEFLDLVRGAVAREVKDERIGAFLSGGTDSSTVAGMLRAVTGAAPEVFSIGFEAAGYDETEFAKIAVKHFDCHHHVYYVTPDDVMAAVPRIAGYFDQPFGNSSAIPSYYCVLMARDCGITKLLAGDGGDELFGGNVRYARQKVLEVYGGALPAALRRSLIEPILLSRSARSAPGLRKIASYIEQARVPMPDRMETYNLLHRHGAAQLFSPLFLDAVDVYEPQALQRRVYAETEGASLVDRMLAFDWRFTLADNDLPKVIGTSSLGGVKVGFPLLDDTLVDLSLRLSPSQKVRRQTLRYWFKQALSDFLPSEIIRKKKHGFGLPFGPWLLTHRGLQRMARDSIDGLIARDVIQASAVDRLFSSELERYPGYYGEMIWILMMAEQWLRRAAPAWRLG